eukprot:2883421-Prymnesium_polylepis.1
MALWSEDQCRAFFESGGQVAPPSAPPAPPVPPSPAGTDDLAKEASAAAKERGTALLKAGDYGKAADAYREALALSTHDAAPLHSNLSLALLRTGDAAAAAAAAEACIAVKPAWHKAHYRL